MPKPILYLTLGYPGSGKSYFSARFAKEHHMFHLRADAVRLAMFDIPVYTPKEHRLVSRTTDYIAEQMLLMGLSVIYDANFNRQIHRQAKRQLAAEAGADCQLWWFQTPLEVALERLAQRKANVYGSVIVPPDEFRRLQAEIEPLVNEPYIAIDGTVPYEEQMSHLTR